MAAAGSGGGTSGDGDAGGAAVDLGELARRVLPYVYSFLRLFVTGNAGGLQQLVGAGRRI